MVKGHHTPRAESRITTQHESPAPHHPPAGLLECLHDPRVVLPSDEQGTSWKVVVRCDICQLRHHAGRLRAGGGLSAQSETRSLLLLRGGVHCAGGILRDAQQAGVRKVGSDDR